MGIIRLLVDDDFKEYVRLSLEAFPAMFPKLTDDRIEGWIKRMQEQQAKKEDVLDDAHFLYKFHQLFLFRFYS